MPTADGIEVRSYRTVFDLERRLYRIDRLRLNPGGVPVRAIVYGLVLAVAVAIAAALPILGRALAMLPWPVRHLAVPAIIATVLTVVRVDGRPCHVAVGSLLALLCGPRRLHAWERRPRRGERWHPPGIVLISDGSDPAVRRADFRGPGAVIVGVAHTLHQRGRRVTLTATEPPRQAERRAVVLAARTRLRVRPTRRR
jgi:hypothetical protein